MDRKTAILRSANEHFACHGFRGASLRDIARDAQVSLTLLNHHFGSKLDLLRAVIQAHRSILDDPVSIARGMLAPGAPTPRMDLLIGAWLDVVQHAAAERDGRYFLRLLSRMVDDPQAEASALVRDHVMDAASGFMQATRAAYPGTSRRNAAIAYLCVVTSMLRCATAADRLGQLETLDDDPPQRHGDSAVAAGVVRAEAADQALPTLGARHEVPAPHDEDGTPVEAGPAPVPAARPPERDRLLRFLVSGMEAVVGA